MRSLGVYVPLWDETTMRMRKVDFKGYCEELEAPEAVTRVCVNNLARDGLWDRKMWKGGIPKRVPVGCLFWDVDIHRGPSCPVTLAALILLLV